MQSTVAANQAQRGFVQDAALELAVLHASSFYEAAGLFPCLCSWKQGKKRKGKKKKKSFYDPGEWEKCQAAEGQ